MTISLEPRFLRPGPAGEPGRADTMAAAPAGARVAVNGEMAAEPTWAPRLVDQVPVNPARPAAPVAGGPAEPATRPSKAERLLQKATEAAAVREHDMNPHVVALRVERVRTWMNRAVWTGTAMLLGFTAANVQAFAAAGAAVGSLAWIFAWLLDPAVSLVLIGLLIGESALARWRVETPRWAKNAKRLALAGTYLMNTWQSWAALINTGTGALAGILLHSIPPLLVFVAVEALPPMNDALTSAIYRARDWAIERQHSTTNSDQTQPDGSDTGDAEDETDASVPAVNLHSLTQAACVRLALDEVGDDPQDWVRWWEHPKRAPSRPSPKRGRGGLSPKRARTSGIVRWLADRGVTVAESNVRVAISRMEPAQQADGEVA